MDLVDPFNYHLYIGGEFGISWFMQDIFKSLHEAGYEICLKYNLCKYFVDTVVLDNMKYGIDESYRCVLLLTDDYEQDMLAKAEIELLKRKSYKFTNEAVSVINLSDKISYGDKYHNFQQIKSPNNKNLDECLHFVINEIKKLLQIRRDLELLMIPKEVGIGAAFGYFYGYLRFVLPNMRSKFYEITLQGLKPKKEDLIKCAVSRYLIIIPENCKGRITFNVENKIQTMDKYVVTSATRAGIKCRDYKSSVHKIICKGTKYYFAGEFSTPTLGMYESYIFGKYGFTLDQLNQERNIFLLALRSLLNECEETKDSYRILYWRNISNDDDNALYEFLQKAVLEEIQSQNKKSWKELTRTVSSESVLNKEIFHQMHDVSTANPKAIYDKDTYKLSSSEVKGLCLVLIYSECLVSGRRDGYVQDKKCIEKIFKGLQFEIEIKEDNSTDKLKDFLKSLEKRNWDRYGCVACCISSHGSNGNIHTSDSKISIFEITKYFNDENCPGLKGKPKLFFIQCCLTDDSMQQPQAQLVPRDPDFLISYCCLPGNDAYRSKSKGSIYYQALLDSLQPSIEIRDCLNKTNDLTDSMLKRNNINNHQKTFYVYTLNKPLYL